MKDLDHLKLPRAGETSSRFTKEQALAAQKFHQTLPGYSVTRLVELPALAKELGVKDIFVKDEASRFGLNSFKGLGGSYCLFHLLSEKYGWSGKVESFAQLKDQIASLEEKPKIISATDGNHGRGLAWICHLSVRKISVSSEPIAGAQTATMMKPSMKQKGLLWKTIGCSFRTQRFRDLRK